MRKAAEQDIPQLLEWGRQFHAASPYADQPFDEERVGAVVRGLMASGVVLISEKGMAAAIKGPVWFSDAEAAQELFWWGDASLRKGLEDWAREQGCRSLSMVCLENEHTERLTRFYGREGYRLTEHHFVKAL